MSDYVVNALVLFGRSQGEKTLGKIKKVNAKTLKVEQLESRGTMRAYPIGTIWTVPYSLVSLAPAGQVPNSKPTLQPLVTLPPLPVKGIQVMPANPIPPRTPTAAAPFINGNIVVFGRGNGEETIGRIDKVNPKRYKITTLETRGNGRGSAKGSTWTVAPSLVRHATDAEKARVQGGTATKTIEVVPAPGKRSEAAILKDIEAVYNRLSPENLSCDGEVRGKALSQKEAGLQGRLKMLFRELGREVSEDEVQGW